MGCGFLACGYTLAGVAPRAERDAFPASRSTATELLAAPTTSWDPTGILDIASGVLWVTADGDTGVGLAREVPGARHVPLELEKITSCIY